MNTQKIVVGVNGSAASDAALRWAIQEAASRGAEIIAVHVLKPAGDHGATVRDVRLREFSYLRADMRSHLKEELFGPLIRADVSHRILVFEGRPASVILQVAEDENADLVVVGNGLHSSVEDLFLGSVAHELSHRVRRPFTLIPFVNVGAVNAMGRSQGPAAAMLRQTWSHRTGDRVEALAGRQGP